MKRMLLAILFLFSISFADELNSRLIVRHIDGSITVYSITYKGQEYLIVARGDYFAVVPIYTPGEKKDIRPSIPAEAIKSFKLE